MSGFDETLATVRDVEGWLTDAQAKRLWERAAALGQGAQIVEIGSFRGRSAIVLARASEGRASLTAIDPHAGNDRGPQQIEADARAGEEDNRAFRANLGRAGVDGLVRHVRLPSGKAIGEIEGELDLLYVDGAHRYAPALDDLRRWGARVRRGGHMLVHDAFSSVGVTLAQLRLVVFGRRFRYLGRAGSLVEYRREDLSGRARVKNTLRQLAELPWFARNLLVKAALVARLRPLARALGHREGPWPF